MIIGFLVESHHGIFAILTDFHKTRSTPARSTTFIMVIEMMSYAFDTGSSEIYPRCLNAIGSTTRCLVVLLNCCLHCRWRWSLGTGYVIVIACVLYIVLDNLTCGSTYSALRQAGCLTPDLPHTLRSCPVSTGIIWLPPCTATSAACDGECICVRVKGCVSRAICKLHL